MSWPPTWDGPHFKQPASAKVRRGLKREARANKEDSKKQQVRSRDKYCRFPLCGCKRFGLNLEVSHQDHKGMGGNPKEDRSEPEAMIYLCSARHKENVFSVDRKTIRWRALNTRDGARGPVAWDIRVAELRRMVPRTSAVVSLAIESLGRAKWFELARETAIHVYEPQTAEQAIILAFLKGMEI